MFRRLKILSWRIIRSRAPLPDTPPLNTKEELAEFRKQMQERYKETFARLGGGITEVNRHDEIDTGPAVGNEKPTNSD